MRHPAGITHTTSLSTTPRAGRDRPSLFLRLIAWVLMVTISTSSLAQAVGPLARGGYGQPYTGFTKNGTLVQGGQVVGNPHQEQHDLLKPGLWSTAAVSFTNSTDPSFIQSNLADIESSIAVTPEPGGRAMSRLYITMPPDATMANPYLDPSAGAPGCDPATTCNQAIYNQLLLDAQANGYSPVGNDGLGASTHIAKTHDSSSDSIYNRGFGTYQTKPVFQAAENPEGGATAFFLLQDAAAASHLRVLQNQSIANLGGLIFYTQQTLKGPGTGLVSRGYDGEFYDPGAEFDRQVGSAPGSFNQDSGRDFQIGYIQPDGQAHAFDLVKDPHFDAFERSAGYGAGEWGSDLNTGSTNNALLGANLRKAAIQNQKAQQAVANLGFDWAKDDRALFYQGINLYNYGNQADNALLRQLERGQITVGSADYVRARALAEQRFKEAYAAQIEYGLKAKFTKEGAKYQAQQLSFEDFDTDRLFNSGLNLFNKKGDREQERLLRALKAGELKPGDARYEEIRGLAEARYRLAYQKALEPPKKANFLKQLVAVVVAAVVVYFTAGAASVWAAGVTGASTATAAGVTTVVTTTAAGVSTAGVAAVGIGSAIGAYAGAVVGAGIQTGSLDKALAAGENSLKGGIANIVVSTALAATGLSATNIGSALNVSDKVGQAVLNTMTSSLSQTIAYGGSLGDTLINSAINNGVNVLSADAANAIGANKDNLGSVGVELAHAGVGCAAGAVRSDSSAGCGAGAVGAVVGHLGAGWVDSANGYTLSDEELAFYGKTIGGVGAALVGSGDKVQENFDIGQGTADNAVVNNYLSTRQLTIALEKIDECQSGCEVLKKSLQRNTQQGGEQNTIGRLEDLCKANPQGCLSTVQDIGTALKELQKPETRALLGDAGTNALIQRQTSDLGKAVEALQWGADHLESSQAIARAAVGVGLTAAGGGLALSLGRAVMAACGSGVSSPACVGLTTELAVGAMETAGGVPTVGLTAASLTATANQLAKTAATATDAAQVVKEVQLVRAEVVAGRSGANGGVPAVSQIDLAPPPNSYPVYTRGAGAAEGPLPPGYTTVSRWVSPEEASLWVQNQGTAIPAAIPRNGTPQLYVTEAGAPYPPGANGTVRIDFAVPNTMLKTGNAPNNFMILQPSSSTPIYNVNIHVPNGVTLPKPR